MSQSARPIQPLRLPLAGWLPFVFSILIGTSAFGGSELLGADKKSVGRILGDGQPLVSGLFNEESSESFSGGIGSTEAYRARVGYMRGRSCYAFFMKKTGESFNPVEAIGLLYLCANGAEWNELELGKRIGRGLGGLIYREPQSKGKAGKTYLATLDSSGRRLFVYSPEWRPDFHRELWITPDEAPVHRGSGSGVASGKLPRHPNSKQARTPELGGELFGKTGSRPGAKQTVPGSKQAVSGAKQVNPSSNQATPGSGKQGIYLPKLNKVVPVESGEGIKSKKGNKRKRGKKGKDPITPPQGK